MAFKLLVVALVLLALGCGRRFVNVGNNTGVPVEQVRAYAMEHGVSFEEAVRQIGQQATAPSRPKQD